MDELQEKIQNITESHKLQQTTFNKKIDELKEHLNKCIETLTLVDAGSNVKKHENLEELMKFSKQINSVKEKDIFNILDAQAEKLLTKNSDTKEHLSDLFNSLDTQFNIALCFIEKYVVDPKEVSSFDKSKNNEKAVINAQPTIFKKDPYIAKFCYMPECIFVGYVKHIEEEVNKNGIKSKRIVEKKEGFGFYKETNIQYFAGQFKDDKYKSGILFKIQDSQVYMGEFTYKNDTSSYSFEGTTMRYTEEHEVFLTDRINRVIFYGKIADTNNPNENIEGRSIFLREIKKIAYCFKHSTTKSVESMTVKLERDNNYLFFESLKFDVYFQRNEALIAKHKSNNQQAEKYYAYILKVGENSYYQGPVLKNYKPHGIGLFLGNEKIGEKTIKIKFEGSFEEGVRKGQGSLYHDDILVLKGEFINDKIAKGISYSLSGVKLFEGEFILGKPSKGTLFYPNGDYFMGEVTEDYKKRLGNYISADKRQLINIGYTENKKQGLAKFIDCDGAEFQLEYNEDKLINFNQLS